MRKFGWWMFLGLALVCGCGDDDSGPTDPGDTFVPPPNPNLVLQDLKTILETKDLGALTDLTHPQAKVFLLASTLREWEQAGAPLGFTYFDRGSFLSVHENIFSGGLGVTPSGNPIPPVDSINVEIMEFTGVWAPFADAGGDFPGLEVGSAPCQVLIYYNNPDQHRWQVMVEVEFFVTQVEMGGNTGYQFLGWREQEPSTKASGTESLAWGGLLTMYR